MKLQELFENKSISAQINRAAVDAGFDNSGWWLNDLNKDFIKKNDK